MGFLDNSGLATLWSKIKALANGKAEKSQATKSITRSGTTYTGTRADGSTYTFTQQDNNTTYSAGTGIALNSTTFSLSAQAARNAMGLGNTTSYVPVANGGTGTDTLPKMITAAGIRYGTVSVTIPVSDSDHSETTASITFSSACPKVPLVFVQIGGPAAPNNYSGSMLTTMTYDITTSGFKIRILSGSSRIRTQIIHWFAICL